MVWSSCGILYIRCDFLHFYPRKERFATKYIFQFARILAFCFLGEILHCVLPLPVPASVYGLVLLLLALNFRLIKLEDVKEVGTYLTGIFPLLFVPAAAGVMELWAEMGSMLLPIVIAIIPVTVLVLGLVGAGLLTLQRAVPVVFGANIGTTVTAQLLAFRLEDARYLLLVAGLLLWFAGRGRLHAAGQALYAFGLLFEGIAVMAEAMEPLAAGPVFRQWMAQVRHRPGLGLLAGLGMTLAVQSSSATIAVLQQAAARPGPDGGCLLGLAGAIPVLLGDNIGTTVTAVLASVGQSRDAKRLAAAHALFNLSGAAVCWLLLPQFTALVRLVPTHGPESAVLARQIANAHTLFNLGGTVPWLPLTPCMVRIVCTLLPEKHAPELK